MKIKNFRRNLSLACSNDDLRPSMCCVAFIDGNAVCTDGHILVEQSLLEHGFLKHEIEVMNGKFVHHSVFKEIYRFDEVTVDENGFHCSKGMISSVIKFTEYDGKFPDYTSVFTKESDSKNVSEINLNVSYMDIIRKITLANRNEVSLKFHGPKRAILISGIYSEKERILLMPIAKG